MFRIFIKEINTIIQQVHIKLITSDRKHIYNCVTLKTMVDENSALPSHE